MYIVSVPTYFANKNIRKISEAERVRERVTEREREQRSYQNDFFANFTGSY